MRITWGQKTKPQHDTSTHAFSLREPLAEHEEFQTHLSGVVWANSDAEVCRDEGVVQELCDVLEGLPMIFTGTRGYY